MQEKESAVRVRIHRTADATQRPSLSETLADFHSDVLWQQKMLHTIVDIRSSTLGADHQETSEHIETDALPPCGDKASVSIK